MKLASWAENPEGGERAQRTVEGAARNRGTPGPPPTQSANGAKEQHPRIMVFLKHELSIN